MKKWLLGSFMLMFIHALPASVDSLVNAANKAYNEGEYMQAVGLYKQVTDQGFESAELYYNLGNACFKSNQTTSAILYYEKARKLDPTDPDILFNLSLANSRIIDKIEPVPEFFVKKWFRSIRETLSPDEWAWLSVISFLVVLAAGLMFLLSSSIIIRKISFWTAAILLFISLSSIALAYRSHSWHTGRHEAIIFTPTITVKSSPNENSVDLFVIHEGTKVEITDELEDWSEIRIANGSIGWVKKDVFQRI